MSGDGSSDNQNPRALPTSSAHNESSFLATMTEWASGVPKMFQKPLAKATGRLLLGMVSVPAAKLGAIADDIKHSQAMREKMRSAIVKDAIRRIPDSHDIGERAIEYFAADIIGKQQNREGVLKSAVEELTHTTPPPEQDSQQHKSEQTLDDDWLNDFACRAESASTSRMRNLFGRILAGEIRNPGSFSLFTLDFLSKLGRADAKIITDISPYVIGESFILTKSSMEILNFSLASRLGSLGILAPTSIGAVQAMSTITLANPHIFQNRFTAILTSGNKVFFFVASQPKDVSFQCSVLTNIGQEVLSLHASDPSPVMLREFAYILSNSEVDLYVANLILHRPEKLSWVNATKIIPESA